MFAYCNNNPVTRTDAEGSQPFVNTMIADGGGNNRMSEEDQTLYSEMQSYGFIPPNGNVTLVNVSKETHERTHGEYVSEKIKGEVLSVLFTFGLSLAYDVVDYGLSLLNLISIDEYNPAPMDYTSYTIYLEYDIDGVCGPTHCWDRRYYILISKPNGKGKYLFLYDFEGGTYS